MEPAGVISETFAEMDLVGVFRRGHRFEDMEKVSLVDLADEALIVFPPHDPHRKRMDEAFEAMGVEPFYRVETPMSETVAAMAANGLGVAVINPLTAMSFPAHQDLGVRPIPGVGKFTIKLWKPIHRPSSSIVKAFSKCLVECRDTHLRRLHEKFRVPQ